jgi:dynactin complex subunit
MLTIVGTHDGVFKKVRYFECAESHGLFVKAERLIPLRSKISY